MEEWRRKFESSPSLYTYVQIPEPNKEPNKSKNPICYYVNKVITNLTRATFKHSGFKVTQDPRVWNASWGRQYSMPEYAKCEAWQKINHFAGAFLMGRKDHLHDRMMELKDRASHLATFYPESYLLPRDQQALEERWEAHPTWIMKPSASSRGRGIHLIRSAESEPPTDAGIVQVYLPRPLLITKRKFDIRLYVYIPSIKPLRVYMHTAGLARFCTHPYSEDGDISDVHMHLTNFTLNKDSDDFVRFTDEERVEGSKWSFEFFNRYMDESGYSSQELTKKFENVSICTVIAGMCEIRKTHCNVIPHRHTSHEMYGIDIMLDEDQNPHLIEINISPSLSGMDSKLDQKLKYPLNLDLLRMGRIIDCDPTADCPCPAVEILDDHYHASMTTSRVEAVESGKVNPWENPVFADFVMIKDYLEEAKIKSGFRMVYPLPETMDDYVCCFDKMCYHDIVFNTWIKMSESERKSVLEKHWHVYMDEIYKIIDEIEATYDEEED